jgi:hypothetical protein
MIAGTVPDDLSKVSAPVFADLAWVAFKGLPVEQISALQQAVSQKLLGPMRAVYSPTSPV